MQTFIQLFIGITAFITLVNSSPVESFQEGTIAAYPINDPPYADAPGLRYASHEASPKPVPNQNSYDDGEYLPAPTMKSQPTHASLNAQTTSCTTDFKAPQSSALDIQSISTHATSTPPGYPSHPTTYPSVLDTEAHQYSAIHTQIATAYEPLPSAVGSRYPTEAPSNVPSNEVDMQSPASPDIYNTHGFSSPESSALSPALTTDAPAYSAPASSHPTRSPDSKAKPSNNIPDHSSQGSSKVSEYVHPISTPRDSPTSQGTQHVPSKPSSHNTASPKKPLNNPSTTKPSTDASMDHSYPSNADSGSASHPYAAPYKPKPNTNPNDAPTKQSHNSPKNLSPETIDDNKIPSYTAKDYPSPSQAYREASPVAPLAETFLSDKTKPLQAHSKYGAASESSTTGKSNPESVKKIATPQTSSKYATSAPRHAPKEASAVAPATGKSTPDNTKKHSPQEASKYSTSASGHDSKQAYAVAPIAEETTPEDTKKHAASKEDSLAAPTNHKSFSENPKSMTPQSTPKYATSAPGHDSKEASSAAPATSISTPKNAKDTKAPHTASKHSASTPGHASRDASAVAPDTGKSTPEKAKKPNVPQTASKYATSTPEYTSKEASTTSPATAKSTPENPKNKTSKDTMPSPERSSKKASPAAPATGKPTPKDTKKDKAAPKYQVSAPAGSPKAASPSAPEAGKSIPMDTKKTKAVQITSKYGAAVPERSVKEAAPETLTTKKSNAEKTKRNKEPQATSKYPTSAPGHAYKNASPAAPTTGKSTPKDIKKIKAPQTASKYAASAPRNAPKEASAVTHAAGKSTSNNIKNKAAQSPTKYATSPPEHASPANPAVRKSTPESTKKTTAPQATSKYLMPVPENNISPRGNDNRNTPTPQKRHDIPSTATPVADRGSESCSGPPTPVKPKARKCRIRYEVIIINDCDGEMSSYAPAQLPSLSTNSPARSSMYTGYHQSGTLPQAWKAM
ncbi:hypothetical protein DSO57_1026822 [Entomophthora muscae]|uniref:Uncharacterized protein n=1 Tax=Entomophthora muscae TaxID=34485 RepID=A0ACC2ULS8_9FUNG|nr:hypothetical protein DSO57_1026822 [Entomophthora muscae]